MSRQAAGVLAPKAGRFYDLSELRLSETSGSFSGDKLDFIKRDRLRLKELERPTPFQGKDIPFPPSLISWKPERWFSKSAVYETGDWYAYPMHFSPEISYVPQRKLRSVKNVSAFEQERSNTLRIQSFSWGAKERDSKGLRALFGWYTRRSCAGHIRRLRESLKFKDGTYFLDGFPSNEVNTAFEILLYPSLIAAIVAPPQPVREYLSEPYECVLPPGKPFLSKVKSIISPTKSFKSKHSSGVSVSEPFSFEGNVQDKPSAPLNAEQRPAPTIGVLSYLVPVRSVDVNTLLLSVTAAHKTGYITKETRDLVFQYIRTNHSNVVYQHLEREANLALMGYCPSRTNRRLPCVRNYLTAIEVGFSTNPTPITLSQQLGAADMDTLPELEEDDDVFPAGPSSVISELVARASNPSTPCPTLESFGKGDIMTLMCHLQQVILKYYQDNGPIEEWDGVKVATMVELNRRMDACRALIHLQRKTYSGATGNALDDAATDVMKHVQHTKNMLWGLSIMEIVIAVINIHAHQTYTIYMTETIRLMTRLAVSSEGQFVAANGIARAIQIAKDLEFFPGETKEAARFNAMAAENFNFEGLSDFTTYFKIFRRSPLSLKLVAAVSAIFSFISFGRVGSLETDFTKMMWDRLCEATGKALDPVELVIDLVEYVTNRSKIYSETGDLKDLFGMSKEQEQIIELSSLINEIEEYRTSKQPSFDPREVLSRCRKALSKVTSSKCSMVLDKARALDRMAHTFEAGLQNTRRKPVAFIVTGPPGTGKTVMVDMVSKIHARRCGVPDDINICHYWMQANHQMFPTIVKVICLNDTFATKSEYSEINIMETLQQMADTAPLFGEGASLEDKANCFVAPDFVFATTNATEYYDSQLASGVTKLDRRYQIIRTYYTERCIARAEQEGVECFNIVEKEGVEGNVHYQVGKMLNDENKKTLSFTIQSASQTFTTLAQLVQWIFQLEQRRDDGLKFDFLACPDCFLPTSNCLCDFTIPRANPPPGSGVPQRLFSEEEESIPLAHPPPGSGIPHRLFSEEEESTPLVRSVLVDEDEFCVEGASMSVTHKVTPNMEAIFNDFNVNIHNFNRAAERTANTAINAIKEAEHKAYMSGVKLICALAAAAGGVAMFIMLLRKFSPQGIVQSTPSFPEEHRTVRENKTNHSPWLGTAVSDDPTVILRRTPGGQNVLYAYMHSPTVAQIPRHFFLDPKSKRWLLQEGDIFAICFQGFEEKVRFEKVRLFIPGDVNDGSEECYYSFPRVRCAKNFQVKQLPTKITPPREECRLGTSEFEQMQGTFEYKIPTEMGYCGLPLVGKSGIVYGIHIGRYSFRDVGLALPMSQELLLTALDAFKLRGLCGETFSDEPLFHEGVVDLQPGMHKQSDAYWYSLDKSIIATGHSPVGHRPFADKPTSSVRPTKIAEHFVGKCKVYTQPHLGHAVRMPDGTYSSAVVKRLDAGLATALYDHNIMMVATKEYLAAIPPPGITMEPLTDWDALCGSGQNVFIRGKDVSKSVGPTFKYLKLPKHEVFKKLREGEYRVHPEAVRMISELEEHLKSDEALKLPLFKASVKDEPYPADKVAKGYCRFFFSADFPVNHMIRKYFLPLMEYMMSIPELSGWVVTMNAGSEQFRKFGEWLDHFPHKFDTDQAGFDLRHAMIHSYYAWFLKGLATKCGYSEGESNVVYRLACLLSRYLVEVEGNVFIVNHGLVSGRSDTICFNCFVIIVTLRYICVKHGKNYDEVMRAGAGGDDCVVSTDLKLFPEFTGKTIIATYSELGYSVTAADKDSEIVSKELSDIQFLKRKWTKEMRGALDLDSIYRSLSYVSGVSLQDEDKRNTAVIQTAFRELFLHGRDVYTQEGGFIATRLNVELPPYDFFERLYQHNMFRTWEVDPIVSSPGLIEGENNQTDHSSLVAGEEKRGGWNLVLQGRATTRRDANMATALPDLFCHTEQNTTPLVAPLNPTEIVSPVGHDAPALDIYVTEKEQEFIKDSRPLFQRMRQPTLSLEQFLSRPRKIATIDSGSFPHLAVWGTWSTLPEVNTVIRKWKFFHGRPKITIVYTGTPQVLGMGRFWFIPAALADDNTTLDVYVPKGLYTQQYYSCQAQAPHLDADFTLTQTLEIVLPYPHQNYYAGSGTNDWTLKYDDLLTLTSASGVTPPVIQFHVYVSYDLEMDVIIPQSNEAPPGIISSGLEYAALVASHVNHPFATSFSKLASLGSTVARAMGFSRPTVEPQNAMVMRNGTNLAVGSGAPSFSYPITIDSLASRSIDDSVFPLSTPNETAISSISSRWGLIRANFTVTSFTPTDCGPRTVRVLGTDLDTTPLWFITSAFTYWTGEIDFCVEIASSPLIKARYGFAIIPPGEAIPTTFPETGAYITEILDVTGSTCHEISIPYLYADNFRKVSSTSVANLVIYSLMDPIGPSPTPVYPRFNIYSRAGKGFSLGVPSLELVDGLLLQSNEPLVLQSNDGVGSSSVSTFGEVIDDIRLLMKRSCLHAKLTPTTTSAMATPTQPFAPKAASGVVPGNPHDLLWSWQTYLATPFMGVTGGSEIKLFGMGPVRIITGEGDSVAWVGPTDNFHDTSRGCMYFDTDNANCVELRVPDRNPSSWRRAVNLGVDFTQPRSQTRSSCWFTGIDGNFTTGDTYYIFGSIADDGNVGGFLATPTLG